MKKLAISTIMMLLAVGLWAETEDFSPVAIEANAGLWYDARPLPGTSADVIYVFCNFRLGGNIDIKYRPSKAIGVGIEAGVQYFFVTPSNSGADFGVWDIPIHVKFQYVVSDALKFDAFVGPLISIADIAVSNSGNNLSTKISGQLVRLNLGARVILGPVFFEGSYAVPFQSEVVGFPRIAFGGHISILK